MKELIEKLTQNIEISIKNNKYQVLSKTKYATIEEQENEYLKYKLTNHKCLIIIPQDEIIYLGIEIEDTNKIDINQNELKYNNQMFLKIADGHQFLKTKEFGESLEAGCYFRDFESEDGKMILSLAVLNDTNVRSDILGEYLFPEIIEIKNM